MRAPKNRLIAFLRKSLRRIFESRRGRALRDGDARDAGRRRHLQVDRLLLAGLYKSDALNAHARILHDDGINDRRDVVREIGQADPVDAIAGAAIVDHGLPLDETRGRCLSRTARLGIRAKPTGPFFPGVFRVAGAHEKFGARLARRRSGLW